MKAPFYTKQGNKKKEVVLNPKIYAARVNERLLELVRRAFAANLRRGTHDTKVRKEVRGGGKKPWKQKGTGRARAGSSRSPIWRGGGTVFGPHPRNYFVPLPKKMRDSALISALSLKGKQKKIMVVEDVTIETPKTKEWAEIMRALPIGGRKTLCVVKEIGPHLMRAGRNLERWVQIKSVRDVNAYHVLERERLLIEENALPVIEERLLAATEKQSGRSSDGAEGDAK
jgi:large subunit ribosomal protein L4